MKPYKYTVAAGAAVTINAKGSFLRGLAGSERYQVRIDGGQPIDFETGIAFEVPEPFSQVRIENTAAATQEIEVAISDRPVFDNRLVGQVDISGGIRAAANRTSDYGAVSVGVAATLIQAANSVRGSILVQNVSANILYLGTDNLVTAANGIKVPAGQAMTLTVDDDIYGIASAAASDIRYLEETL